MNGPNTSIKQNQQTSQTTLNNINAAKIGSSSSHPHPPINLASKLNNVSQPGMQKRSQDMGFIGLTASSNT